MILNVSLNIHEYETKFDPISYSKKFFENDFL